MIFHTERLLVRQFGFDDFEYFFRLNNDEEVMRYIRPVKNREQALQFFEENLAYYQEFPRYGRWAMLDRASKHFIGTFMLKPSGVLPGEIELGYALNKENWGKGYATESVFGGLDYAFDRLGLDRLIAITQPNNMISQKVLIKSGFIQENNMEDNGRIINLFRIIKASHG